MQPDHDETLAAGAVLDGAYVVERFLAHGGMGRVYVARDLRLDRRVAIKVLHASLVTDQESTLRFQREAQLLSRICHPNVVAIHGFGKVDGRFYLAMEFVEGEPLEDLLQRVDRLPVGEAVAIARQIASALAEAHALGILHRDIKPGNVLLRRLASGVVTAKVVDFGLARAFDAHQGDTSEVTGEARLLGTPSYMAPEQIQGGQLDGRTDQYALAVLLFRLLTGTLPIQRQGTQGMLIGHLVDAPAPLPPLEGIDARTRFDLEAVLHRSLSKAADQRYESMAAFLDALQQASGGAASPEGQHGCTICDGRNPAGAAFCGHCGAGLPQPVCANCGSKRLGERWFCAVCGESLRPATRWLLDGLDASGREVMGAVLVGRLREDAAAAAGRFATLVERAGGRAVGALGNECVAVFGLGGMRDDEPARAVEVALTLLADDAAEADAGDPSGPSAGAVTPPHGASTATARWAGFGVAMGTLRTRGQGHAWGHSAILGAPIDRARALAAQAARQLWADRACAMEIRDAFYLRPLHDASGPREDIDADPSSAAQTWHVAAPRPPAGAAMEVHLRRIPLVGRHDALDDLLMAARTCQRRRCLTLAAVTGDRGAGKTRVLSEVSSQLRDQGWTVWAVACRRTAPSPWQPVVDLLYAALGDGDDRDASWSTRLASLPHLRSAPPHRIAQLLAPLEQMLGLLDDSTIDLRAARPASEAEQSNAYAGVIACLRGAVGAGPALIVLDDLDLARAQVLGLLDHVLRALSDLPILVAGAIDASQTSTILDSVRIPANRLALVPLSALTREEIGRLAASTLASPPPDPVVDALVDVSHGKPAILLEYLQLLTDPAAGGGADPWHDLGHMREVLSRGRQDLFLRRIQRLSLAERSLLDALAVVGDAAPLPWLAAIVEREVDAQELEHLRRRDMVATADPPRFGGGTEVLLRPPWLGEAVLQGMPAATRRHLHERAGAWLDAWKGPRPSGFGAMQARHHLGAGHMARACRSLLKSGQEAMRALANREAFDTLGEAADVARSWLAHSGGAETREVLLDALLLRSELGAQLGALEAAEASAREALGLAGAATDAAAALAAARAQLVVGEVAARRGAYEDASAAFAAAERVRPLGSVGAGLSALATGRRAMVLLRCGDADAASRVATEGIVELERLPPTADVENGLGRLETVLGHLANRRALIAEASARFSAAQRRFESSGDRIGAAMSVLALGNCAYIGSDLATAEAHFREAVARSESLGYVQGLTAGLTNLGNVLLDRGALDQALTELQRAEALERQMGALDLMPETLRLMALCRCRRGQLAAALPLATEAVAIARDLRNPRMEEDAIAVLDEIESHIESGWEGADSSGALPEGTGIG